tara:strand:- start:1531 stop:1770 length:240 start_codon:yes stop_codon:yes gene_type:complete
MLDCRKRNLERWESDALRKFKDGSYEYRNFTLMPNQYGTWDVVSDLVTDWTSEEVTLTKAVQFVDNCYQDSNYLELQNS